MTHLASDQTSALSILGSRRDLSLEMRTGSGAMPEQISSPSNKRIQWLRSLHSPRGRQEAGAFLVEGPHLLEAALDAHLRPLLIIYDDEALSRTSDGTALLGRIGHAAASGIEILRATAPAIER